MARRRLLSDIWAEYNGNKSKAITLDEFGEAGGTASFNLECSGAWKVASKPDWVTLSKTSGDGGYNGNITITVAAAPTTDGRNGDVIIKSVSSLLSVKIHVSQEGIQDYVLIDSTTAKTVSVPWYAGSGTIGTSSVNGWNATNTSAGLTLTPATANAGSVSVTYAYTANTDTGNTRTLTSDLRSKIYAESGLHATLTVNQNAKSYIQIVNVTPSSFGFEGGNGSIVVKSNTTGWTLTSSNSGLTFGGNTTYTYTGSTVGSNITVSFNAAENTNTASTVTYTVTAKTSDYAITSDNDAIDTANITLDAYPYLYFTNKPTASVSKNAQTVGVVLNSNAAWGATSNAAWATVAAGSGTGDKSPFNVTLTENTSITDNRTATITATANSKSTVKDSYTITQLHTDPYVEFTGTTPEGGTITVTPILNPDGTPTGDYNISIRITHSAQNVSLSLKSNDGWSITTSGGFTCTPTSGTGDKALTMGFTENTGALALFFTATATTAHVKNNGDYAKAYITIEQEGSLWLIPSETGKDISANAGSYNITFDTTGAFKQASEFASWVTPSTKTGVSGDTITYTIAANNSIVPRSTTADFVLVDYTQVNEAIEFRQAGVGVTFSINPTTKTIGKDGGTFRITVTANCKWTATSTLDLSMSGNDGRTGGTIDVTVPACTEVGTDTRSFVVNVSTNDAYAAAQTLKCTITQSKVTPYISITESSLDFGTDGGVKTITVTSNSPWRIKSGYNTAMVTSISPSNGAAGTTSVSVSVSSWATQSSRSTSIVAELTNFTAYNDSVTVSQSEYIPQLYSDDTTLELASAQGSTIGGSFISYGNFSLTYPSFVTFSGTETGGTDGSKFIGGISLTSTTENTSALPKTGDIKITLTNFTKHKDKNGNVVNNNYITIPVSQKGSITVTLTASDKTAPVGGKTITLYVNSTVAGTLYVNGTAFDTFSVGNSQTFTYTIPANTSFSTKDWVFMAKSTAYPDVYSTATVTQDAVTPYISFDTTSKTVGATAGSFTATLTTNDPNWSIASTGALITSVTPTTGSETSKTITIKYGDNFGSSRTATVTATSANGKKATISITQSATTWSPYLKLAWANSSVSAGATSNTLNYTANTSFNLTVKSGGGTLASTSKTISQSYSNSTGSITYSFGANSSTSTITHTVSGATVAIAGFTTATDSVSFTQAAYTPSISVNPYQVAFNAAAVRTSTNSVFTVKASDAWEMYDKDSWITVNTSEGAAGTTNVTPSVGYNNSTSAKSGKVYFRLKNYPTYTDYGEVTQTAGSEETTTFDVKAKLTQDTDGKWTLSWTSDQYMNPTTYGTGATVGITVASTAYSLTGTSGSISNVGTTAAGTAISASVTREATWNTGWNKGVYTTYVSNTSLTVTPAAGHTFDLTASSTSLAWNATSLVCTATSNYNYNIALDGAQSSTETAATSGRRHTFTISRNIDSGKKSSARTFTVSGATTDGAASDTLTFTQAGYDDRVEANITLSSTTRTIAGNVTSFDLTIDTDGNNSPWKLTWTTSPLITSVSQSEGTGDTTVTVTLRGNPTSTVTYSFTATTTYETPTYAEENASDSWTMTQTAIDYDIDLEDYDETTYESKVIALPLTVTPSTSNWSVAASSSPSAQIRLGTSTPPSSTSLTGTGNATIYVGIPTNNSYTDSRTITLTARNTSASAPNVKDIVTITQDCKPMTLTIRNSQYAYVHYPSTVTFTEYDIPTISLDYINLNGVLGYMSMGPLTYQNRVSANYSADVKMENTVSDEMVFKVDKTTGFVINFLLCSVDPTQLQPNYPTSTKYELDAENSYAMIGSTRIDFEGENDGAYASNVHFDTSSLNDGDTLELEIHLAAKVK